MKILGSTVWLVMTSSLSQDLNYSFYYVVQAIPPKRHEVYKLPMAGSFLPFRWRFLGSAVIVILALDCVPEVYVAWVGFVGEWRCVASVAGPR